MAILADILALKGGNLDPTSLQSTKDYLLLEGELVSLSLE